MWNALKNVTHLWWVDVMWRRDHEFPCFRHAYWLSKDSHLWWEGTRGLGSFLPLQDSVHIRQEAAWFGIHSSLQSSYVDAESLPFHVRYPFSSQLPDQTLPHRVSTQEGIWLLKGYLTWKGTLYSYGVQWSRIGVAIWISVRTLNN